MADRIYDYILQLAKNGIFVKEINLPSAEFKKLNKAAMGGGQANVFLGPLGVTWIKVVNND